jgi:hypothetical protein
MKTANIVTPEMVQFELTSATPLVSASMATDFYLFENVLTSSMTFVVGGLARTKQELAFHFYDIENQCTLINSNTSEELFVTDGVATKITVVKGDDGYELSSVRQLCNESSAELVVYPDDCVLDLNPNLSQNLQTTGSTLTAISSSINASHVFLGSVQLETGIWKTGTNSLLFSGSGATNKLQFTSSLASSFVGGNDNNYSVYVVAQFLDATPANPQYDEHVINFTNSSTGSPVIDAIMMIRETGRAVFALYRRDDGTDSSYLEGGTPNNNKHVYCGAYTGTNGQLFIDGSQIINGGSNVGQITIDCITLGGGSQIHMRVARVLGFPRQLNTDEHNALVDALTEFYQI